jgi:hypothetical protein
LRRSAFPVYLGKVKKAVAKVKTVIVDHISKIDNFNSNGRKKIISYDSIVNI